MRKFTMLFALLFTVFTWAKAQETVQVTLQVDLSGVTDMYDGGGVWVYMDADWSEYYDMTDDDGDGIYEATVEKESGSVLPYRFSYQNGEDPNSNYTEEAVPAECANADGFREITVTSHNITLDPVTYETCFEAPALVTLQVDMSAITDLYQASGTVWVYMDDEWSEWYTMVDEEEDGIYEYTLEKEVGSTLTYSFAYQNGPSADTEWVAETVPSECANDGGYRTYDVQAADVTLPAFAFGSCTDVAPPPAPTVNITFQVDMSLEANPNNVMVVIKNPWIWTAMTDGGNGIWSATVEVDANAEYPYTFVNGGQDNWDEEEKISGDCNFGSETAPERHITVAEDDVTADLVSFGSCEHITAINTNEAVLNIYPNPASDMVTIQLSNEKISKVQIFDMSGKVVLTEQAGSMSSKVVNVRDLEKGIYLLKVSSERNEINTRIVIQ